MGGLGRRGWEHRPRSLYSASHSNPPGKMRENQESKTLEGNGAKGRGGRPRLSTDDGFPGLNF